MNAVIRKIFYLLIIATTFTACGTKKNSIKTQQKESEKIISYAHKYINSPYRYGGTSPKGFDCSGYVQYVYKNFGYNLPRTTIDQAKYGKEIKRKDLKPGDLVFFKGRNKKSKKAGHVGIVTQVNKNGNFMFIHASTSKGVRVDDCNLSYYKERYIKARRVINN